MQWLESAPSGLATLSFLPTSAKGHYFNVNLHDFQGVLFSVVVGLCCFNRYHGLGVLNDRRLGGVTSRCCPAQVLVRVLFLVGGGLPTCSVLTWGKERKLWSLPLL